MAKCFRAELEECDAIQVIEQDGKLTLSEDPDWEQSSYLLKSVKASSLFGIKAGDYFIRNSSGIVFLIDEETFKNLFVGEKTARYVNSLLKGKE